MLEDAGTAISCNDENPELEEPAGFEDQAQFVHWVGEARGFAAAYFAALAAGRDLGSTRDIAVVGYPIVTVPLGSPPDNHRLCVAGNGVPALGVPFGPSFLGTAFSDFQLISFGFAYEEKTQTRLARKALKYVELEEILAQWATNFAQSGHVPS
ncbi:hypothetical protein B0H13DRAFT_2380907 [Mycena leptocephala]|nr:hypothetical protein B0H13DRAFT_2380907 [Mycena leptocephala]